MTVRSLLLAACVAVLAPSAARADCVATCADICDAPTGTSYYRGEVIAAQDGYGTRVRLVEHLAGPDLDAVGDELVDVYAESIVEVGASLFVPIAPYTDGPPGTYQYNVARLIRDGDVVCPYDDRDVPLDQFAAMATSPGCVAISQQLQLAHPPCDDTVGTGGCSAGSGGLGFGVAGALALVLRRRRR